MSFYDNDIYEFVDYHEDDDYYEGNDSLDLDNSGGFYRTNFDEDWDDDEW